MSSIINNAIQSTMNKFSDLTIKTFSGIGNQTGRLIHYWAEHSPASLGLTTIALTKNIGHTIINVLSQETQVDPSLYMGLVAGTVLATQPLIRNTCLAVAKRLYQTTKILIKTTHYLSKGSLPIILMGLKYGTKKGMIPVSKLAFRILRASCQKGAHATSEYLIEKGIKPLSKMTCRAISATYRGAAHITSKYVIEKGIYPLSKMICRVMHSGYETAKKIPSKGPSKTTIEKTWNTSCNAMTRINARGKKVVNKITDLTPKIQFNYTRPTENLNEQANPHVIIPIPPQQQTRPQENPDIERFDREMLFENLRDSKKALLEAMQLGFTNGAQPLASHSWKYAKKATQKLFQTVASGAIQIKKIGQKGLTVVGEKTDKTVNYIKEKYPAQLGAAVSVALLYSAASAYSS